jgi:hypothetical protein
MTNKRVIKLLMNKIYVINQLKMKITLPLTKRDIRGKKVKKTKYKVIIQIY